jgi:hypothetical protein
MIRGAFVVACLGVGLAADVGLSRGRLRRPTAAAVLCALLFAAIAVNAWALVRLWTGHSPTYSAFGGLLPWQDAAAYYAGARHLIATGGLDEWNSRRPLMAAYLAGMLALDGGDLQLTLVAMAIACSVVAAWTSSTLIAAGRIAGVAIAFAVMITFSRTLAGLTLSEQLGFVLGGAGAALLWQSAADGPGQLARYLTGVAALSAGLAARPGALLVPVCLIVARGVRRGRVWAIAGALASALGFSANTFVRAVLPSHAQPPMANFAHTLYGLTAGGRGWDSVLLQHPELQSLGDAEASRRIYSLALGQFLDAPEMLALGLARGTLAALGPDGLIGFLDPLSGVLVVALPLAIHLTKASDWRGDGPGGLIALPACAGILVCAPIIAQDGGYRVFAATTPLLALVIGWSVARTLDRLLRPLGTEHGHPPGPMGTVVVAAGLVVLVLVLPTAFRFRARPDVPLLSPAPCADPWLVRVQDGSRIFVGAGPSTASLRPVAMSEETFDSTLPPEAEARDQFRSLPAGTWVVDTFCPVRLRQAWLAIPAAMIGGPGDYAVCGDREGRLVRASSAYVLRAATASPSQ